MGQSNYDTCYRQCATGTVIMSLVKDNVLQGQAQYSLVMHNVPLGQIHYDTCYA